MADTLFDISGKIALVTGGTSGIGRMIAEGFAARGAKTYITGRDQARTDRAAEEIGASGDGECFGLACDLSEAGAPERLIAVLRERESRLDILVNNAGLNITNRSWRQLDTEGIDQLVQGNLSSAMYCAAAVLPIMRAQKDGILIHTASVAGRVVSLLSGAGYTAAKHGLVAASHSINMEECVNGIRSTVVCPGEVATPILDRRPVPVSKEDRDRMLQSEDVGDLIRYIACLPPHVCINEVMVSPTWNRGYVAALQQAHVKV